VHFAQQQAVIFVGELAEFGGHGADENAVDVAAENVSGMGRKDEERGSWGRRGGKYRRMTRSWPCFVPFLRPRRLLKMPRSQRQTPIVTRTPGVRPMKLRESDLNHGG
jgi:hypothetical protein